MRRLRRHARWALLPALGWLITQSVMSFAVVALPSSSIDKRAEWPLAAFVICSSDGPKWVAASDVVAARKHDREEGQPDQTGGMDGCPWCQAFGSVAVPTRAAQAIACFFPATGVVFYAGEVLFGPSKAASAGFRSRAPPA